MLYHGLRRWADIEITLGQRVVFAGLSPMIGEAKQQKTRYIDPILV